MECKFAIKYDDKRLYLAKMYPRLSSSVQKAGNRWTTQIWLDNELIYMSILDGYRNFTHKTYIKSEKSAIVYGDVYESRAPASILPYFKG